MPPLASVVITNWNGCHFLEKCLGSLAAQTYPAVEIILVDNGSTDGSAAWVGEHFPAVRLIANARNMGFAAANNQGIRVAQGEYVALLNNDTWVEPDWLAELVQAIESGPRVGMVASKMVYADQPQVINSTGVCLDRSGVVWDRQTGLPEHVSEREPVEIFGPCAGAALYRHALFDDVGVFDENFFAYLEDVDLAWRARWRGWRAIYTPTARVYHVHSATGKEGSPLKTYLLAKNKITMLVKNYPSPHWLGWLPWIVLYELLSFAFAVLNGVGLSALRGRLAGLRALPTALRQRRALRAKPHLPASEVFSWQEPAAWPWQVYARYRHLHQRPATHLRSIPHDL